MKIIMMSERQQKIIVCLFFIGILAFLAYLLTPFIPIKNDSFSLIWKIVVSWIGFLCWMIFCIMGLVYKLKKTSENNSKEND
ncbi:hypothetical protein [Breznakiella homolactica]|uniref:Uncharacterized protein n=1 Tax=Breznakiella homolactica TaxID=2798577 RepID=A0A7T7XR41_9SPIR|nr:hypothetical protein [Breznakiella homolactica]QQO10897.1 hypothetical protein JFL75_08265 [Breznakiella homolactica]